MKQIKVKDILDATGGKLVCGNSNIKVEHISIDSRVMQGNDLFVPIVGEKVDAHRFIPQVFPRGAAATLTEQPETADGEHPFILVENSVKTLQDIGAWYRNRLSVPLVGVTGSVGKTSTREMIAAALAASLTVHSTKGNSNGQLGVPLTLSEMTGMEDIGVIEMGMSEPGEMSVIAHIARVNMAVMTNIGVSHIEQLGSREAICREKLHITDEMDENAVLFLNGDDELLMKLARNTGVKTLTYGMGGHCDYQAKDVHMEDNRIVFTAVCKPQGESRIVRLQVPGLHNVQNAMAAIAVAVENHVPFAKAVEALENFTGFARRLEIRKAHGMTIIDDAYNASPDSMRAALQVLDSLETTGCKWAVLADMLELGPDSPRFHYETGAYAGSIPIDRLVTVGERAAKIAEGAREKNPSLVVFECKTNSEAIEYLQKELQSGDMVLLKGSNGMNLKEVLGAITA